MEPLTVGIVGLGGVATVHLTAYQTVQTIRVVAGADPDAGRARWARESYGLRTFGSAYSMLQDEDLDIVCILSPAATHAELTLASADAGAHVLCEKPMALSVGDCRRMTNACRTSGVRFCYGASYRYLPALMKAREIVLSGELGDILLLREEVIGGRGPDSRQMLGPAHYPLGGPGGSGMGLVDHGVHLIDTFTWLMNSRVTRAVGQGNIAGAPSRPEYAVLDFENGARGHLVYEDGTFPTSLPTEGIFSPGGAWGVSGYVPPGSWHAHPGCIHVHGTRGALRVFHYANALFITTAAGIRQVPVLDRPMPGNFAMQMEAFVSAIGAGADAPVDGRAGEEACRVLLEIYAHSQRSGDVTG